MILTAISSVIGLIMFPIISLVVLPATLLTQISEINSVPAQPVISASFQQVKGEMETAMPCGLTYFEIGTECGVEVYKNPTIQCSDGYKTVLGDESSCQSFDAWNQYAKNFCAKRYCKDGYQPLPSPVAIPESIIPEKPAMTIIPEATVPAPESKPAIIEKAIPTLQQSPTTSASPVPGISTAVTTIASPDIKCGLINYKVCNECGLGVYKNVIVQCSDGSEINLGSASSCKPAELWNQYAKEVCTIHCLTGGWGGWSDFVSNPIVCAEGVSGDANRPTPIVPATIRSVEIPKATPVCYISDDLFQKYNQLIIELQKSESDKTRTEEITQQIIALKQQIASQQNECVQTSSQVTPIITSRPVSSISLIVVKNTPVTVAINRCNEVAQWETKIVYYRKLSGLSYEDLKKSGFSRAEIEKILQELSIGIEKVRAQCSGQESKPVMPKVTAITGSAFITETVRPVVIESGPEISAYYKSRLEKASSIKGEDKQIEELKSLRDEIDTHISNLIKSRPELEVKELDTLIQEVKISRGEIKADDMAIKTTEKKILVNIGDNPVSVEPTISQVLIKDKGLEVNANEVTIKENMVSVGGIEVKMSASEVTEKLGLAPKTIELKEENAKAVYNMKIEERRKLFGFIPFISQKSVTADAENGQVITEHLPWYNFLTTK